MGRLAGQLDGVFGRSGAAHDEAAMADPDEAGEALPDAVVGVDEKHAEGACRCSRVGHGRSVGRPRPRLTATDVEIALRHSADPRIEARASSAGGRDSAAARSIASGGTFTSIVVPSPGRDLTAKVAPILSARARIPASPRWPSGTAPASKPLPSSRTCRTTA